MQHLGGNIYHYAKLNEKTHAVFTPPTKNCGARPLKGRAPQSVRPRLRPCYFFARAQTTIVFIATAAATAPNVTRPKSRKEPAVIHAAIQFTPFNDVRRAAERAAAFVYYTPVTRRRQPPAQYSGGAQSKDLKAGVSEGVLFDYRLAVNKL